MEWRVQKRSNIRRLPKPLWPAAVLARNAREMFRKPHHRGLIPEVGFVFAKSVEIDSIFLPGLKADADGMVRGDEFHLPIPNGLIELADWCDAWQGKLLDGTDATVDLLGNLTLKGYGTALREMAAAASGR